MARSKDSGKEGAAARMKKSAQLLARVAEWPESWAIDDDKDVRKGEELAAVLREFAQSLVEDGLAPSTIIRKCACGPALEGPTFHGQRDIDRWVDVGIP